MAHIHEKIDFVVGILIVNGDAVLLRKHDKYKIWLDVGGHIELDEDPIEAAVREAKEEVGLDITIAGNPPAITEGPGYVELIAPRFMNRHKIGEHEHINLMYFATSPTREIVQGPTEISDEIKWFTRKELDDPKYGLLETMIYYGKAALDELGAKS